MSDPQPIGEAATVLQGVGTTAFAALVYFELRDLRRLVARVLLARFPGAAGSPDVGSENNVKGD